MIGVILSGHGNIASGFKSGMELVFGSASNFDALDFSQEVTPEELEKNMKNKIEEFNKGKGVLILTDIAGGTPFKTASMLSLQYENVKVISGVNFSMLLEVISERDSYQLNDLYLHAIETGKSEIKAFEVGNKKKVETVEDEMGI